MTDCKQTYAFVAHAQKVRGTRFKANSTIRSRDKAQRVFRSVNKVPLKICRSQEKLAPFLAHARGVRGKTFQKNPTNRRRVTTEM